MNYIKINNQKIPLTDEQVEQIRNTFVPGIALSSIEVGKTFKLGKYEFIVLEHAKETTAVIFRICFTLPESLEQITITTALIWTSFVTISEKKSKQSSEKTT